MKMNQATKGSQTITNRASGKSYKLSDKQILVQIVTTYLFKEPKYYGDVEKQLNYVVESVAKEDPEFILKLAAFNRNEMYLRTVSIYLLAKASTIVECKPFVRKYAKYIIKRADEINEVIAALHDICGKEVSKKGRKVIEVRPFPNSIKKSIRDAFNRFDEYQIAKYNRKGVVTFKDAIKIAHVPRTAITEKIISNTLSIPKTWETEISAKGSTKESWEDVIDNVFWKNGKINNYMAILRNLNNIIKARVSDDHYMKTLEAIENRRAIKNSKLFPFRFYSAMKYIKAPTDPFKFKYLKSALNKALGTSVDNLPKLEGRTLCSADTSGSMAIPLSAKSNMQYIDISSLMTAMCYKFSEDAIASVFGTNFTTVPLSNNILDDTEKIRRTDVGWSTHGHLVVDYAINKSIHIDRFIIFTDEEMYGKDSYDQTLQRSFERYLKIVNPNALLYVVNFNGYGESSVNVHNKNVVTVSGWSEKILNFIAEYEKGTDSFINKIDKYEVKP